MASKVKQTILAIAIAVVLALFVGFSIHAFYPGPKYENYCNINQPQRPYETNETCKASGGRWNDYGGAQPKCPPEQTYCPNGYCDMYYNCQRSFDDANRVYTRNVFIAATIIGLIAVLIGGVILKLESVSSGIMGGGVLSMIYGTIVYWMDASNYLRVIILGIVLAILIWMGYKKLSK
jgi:hypothetical protein